MRSLGQQDLKGLTGGILTNSKHHPVPAGEFASDAHETAACEASADKCKIGVKCLSGASQFYGSKKRRRRGLRSVGSCHGRSA